MDSTTVWDIYVIPLHWWIRVSNSFINNLANCKEMKIHNDPIIDTDSMTWSYGWYTGEYLLNVAQETVHLRVDQIPDIINWGETKDIVTEYIKQILNW